MKKILLMIFSLVAISIALPEVSYGAPVIKQFTTIDTYGTKWTLTATSFEGDFPTESFILDGNCDFNFFMVPQEARFDVIKIGIAKATPTVNRDGIITTTANSMSTLRIYEQSGIEFITMLSSPGLGKNPALSQVNFHLIYQ